TCARKSRDRRPFRHRPEESTPAVRRDRPGRSSSQGLDRSLAVPPAYREDRAFLVSEGGAIRPPCLALPAVRRARGPAAATRIAGRWHRPGAAALPPCRTSSGSKYGDDRAPLQRIRRVGLTRSVAGKRRGELVLG